MKRTSDVHSIGKEGTSFDVDKIRFFADVPESPNSYPMGMDRKRIVLLILTRSIPLADGLDALLKATPHIDEVQIARNPESAYQQIEARNPRIILIDSALLGSNPEAPLEKIQTLSPETQRVLLVDNVQEVNLMPKYAEAILVKGILPSAIAAIVTTLLSTKGDENERNDSNP